MKRFAVMIILFFRLSLSAVAQSLGAGLFDSEEVLSISLKGPMRELLKDRRDMPKLYPLILSYKQDVNTDYEMPVQVKTRGHFRRMQENCSYPPLLIQFPNKGAHLSTIFKEQSKLKLVMPCAGDEYIIREWLAYKIYNLVTPGSFKTRLVKVSMEDAGNKKTSPSFYGILLEEEMQMARRNNMVSVVKRLLPHQIQKESFYTMSVFQYLIGNTDWSIQFLQNIKLLARDSISTPVAVPYDFDHAGIVYAPYARPAEELQMNSVRERRFRGYCIQDLKVFEPVIANFNQIRNDIYNLFKDCALLDAKYIRATIKYLDEFYATINSPKAWKNEFAYPCDKNGTGNIVIKGLKKD